MTIQGGPVTGDDDAVAGAWSQQMAEDQAYDRRCRVKKGTLKVDDCERAIWMAPDTDPLDDCLTPEL